MTYVAILVHIIPFDFISHLTGLHSIKLPDDQAILAQFTQAVIEDTNHLVCDRLVDETKPILDVLSCDLSHHTVMPYPCINIIRQPALWVLWGVITNYLLVVTFTMTRSITNMD